MKQLFKFKQMLGAITSIVASISLYGISSAAFAGTVVCSGTVATLAYHAPNNLMLRLSSMNSAVFICNPDANWVVTGTTYTTGTETCKTMYSIFLTAKATGKTVTAVYFDGDDVPSACDGWGSWKRANIRYFELH